MLRAEDIVEMAKDAARYRFLCELVAFGDWSIGVHEVIDNFGLTDDTYMEDKADADAHLDVLMKEQEK